MKNTFTILFLFIALFLNRYTFSQNFWEQTSGPFEGAVNSLAINLSDHIFAGTNNGGVFRSTQ